MNIQNFEIADGSFATADTKNAVGTIRVEAAFLPGLPVEIDSIIWLENGNDGYGREPGRSTTHHREGGHETDRRRLKICSRL